MNTILATETFLLWSVFFASGAIASFVSLVFAKIFATKIKIWGQHRFIWLCVFLSLFVIFVTLMVSFTPWQQSYKELFATNKIFYILLFLFGFLIVFFSRFIFVIVVVVYVLYAALAWYEVKANCMDAKVSFSVNLREGEGVANIEYVNFSPHLFLPFKNTWISGITTKNIEGLNFKPDSNNKKSNWFAGFLFAHSTTKFFSVEIPAPQTPPEKWQVILNSKNGIILSEIKRLL